MSHYELETCNLYIFDNLAVKADQNGLEIFCKANMSIADTVEKWGLEEIDASFLAAEYRIPQDKVGNFLV